MNPDPTRRRIAKAIIVLVIGALLGAYKLLDRTTITLVLSPKSLDIATTSVSVDGHQATYVETTTSGYLYRVRTSSGKRLVSVYGKTFSTYSQTIQVGFREKKSLEISLEDKINPPAATAADELYDGALSSSTEARYFGDNSWLVFNSAQGSIVIAREIKNDWQIVEEGSEIDLSSPDYSGAPADMITYIKGQQ